ncbi:uncharacterized protein H6S33_004627 [Morchella sextelata]|uniref:uncharacterized protein n=1 Tax=Morchella sextelata TaxID=1174677 RepID=UPI001D059674|nr:uncharacterized protein H6S33_004627 [Morchella sextelata]KAH0605405.1 hypothetical protein H6S33_004627 [Morchella sextelata]
MFRSPNNSQTIVLSTRHIRISSSQFPYPPANSPSLPATFNKWTRHRAFTIRINLKPGLHMLCTVDITEKLQRMFHIPTAEPNDKWGSGGCSKPRFNINGSLGSAVCPA